MDLAEGKNSNSNKHEIANTSLVAVPPMIVSELSSDRVSLEEGETATLICNVTGIPKPNVTWYKRNSRKMDGKRERKYTGALVCFQFAESYAALYASAVSTPLRWIFKNAL